MTPQELFKAMPANFTTGTTGDKGSRYRLPSLTDEQVLRLCARAKGYHVGVRYRDDNARKQAGKLVGLGLVKAARGPRYGDGTTYTATDQGRALLATLQRFKP